VKAVLFDFGGTLDTNGLHWSEKFWSVYQDFDVPISKGEFEAAYIAAESTMANRGVAASDDLLRTLKKQVDLQFEELHRNNLLRSNISSEVLSLIAPRMCGRQSVISTRYSWHWVASCA
jgi:putative hydrolase of the HAD superfamily